ncbi:uncharacterized protein N7483_012882 [Penicillium malachiteum]|uniref:uncharacterized protein n=1 Tax=Penicillium malachiteum TaxID=1324776 RepID=UPI002547FDEE|nr:uncharacterized protein N7483_012882 [Penicillium malachiteum]KAJ5715701.1 hypothetical protein N7483_012882 [Penicillium malachiteum]
MAMEPSQCELYIYAPSFSLALAAIIIFSVLTTVHFLRMTRSKAWSGIYFVLGGIAQTSGYTARLFSTQDPCNRVAYGIQSVLLLLGPTVMMFSVNLAMIEFTRALRAERFCWIPIDFQRPVCLSVNTALVLLQFIGGIMTVSSTTMNVIAMATKIGIAVFVTQTIFWLFTLAEHTYMTIRLRHVLDEANNLKPVFPNWKYWSQLFGLAISIIATGRNIVRLTMDGGIAFLIENEWPSYAFDGYQMIIVMGAWAIWYLPGKLQAELETYTSLPIHTRDPRFSGEGRAQRRHDRVQRRQERLGREHLESYGSY